MVYFVALPFVRVDGGLCFDLARLLRGFLSNCGDSEMFELLAAFESRSMAM
jgi:hypothetical protein